MENKLEVLIIKALENTKELVTSKGFDKKLSAKENILKHDDVFVEMLGHIVKSVSDKDIRMIWSDHAAAILTSCEGISSNSFHQKGREGVEIYLEKVVFEHFEIWGFKSTKK